MEEYQQDFIDFATDIKALCFGEFKLKSGRLSPYFFNSGLFNTGASLARLGQYYAAAIVDSAIEFDLLYGPAYKGIPLAAATAVSLAIDHNIDIPYSFNRKEAKDHGEGGTIVGSPLKGRVLIIDDVISAGTSVRESVEIIKASGATPAGVVISLDRQERGKGDLSAIQEVQRDYQLKVASIVSLTQLVEHLQQSPDMQNELTAIQAYRDTYGSN